MSDPSFVNEAIRMRIIDDIYTTYAMIIFNADGAALMMPTGGVGSDGKRYKIWSNLPSREAAVEEANGWGRKMPNIRFAYQEEKDIPENPETLLCNYFLINFA